MSSEHHQFELTELPLHGMRLDQVLVTKMPGFSRSRIQALIKQQQVFVNDKIARSSDILKNSDRISVTVPAAIPLEETLPEEMPLDILYEDKDLLVLNKPAGLTVHPGAGQHDHTLVNGLLHHCKTLSGIGGVQRPGIVHRLDKETSGCLVVAKNDKAHQSLSKQFAGREVEKTYLAIVPGRITPPSGIIEAAIGRHKFHRQKMTIVEETLGRPSTTLYKALESDGKLTLVECRPKTGRTHQIRVHLKHIGHGILGDPVYGNRGKHSRHMLHAWKLSFVHPRTGKTLESVAPLPAEFRELLPNFKKLPS
ncbi:MAG: RluA family pseudouridine synthase [Chthoniobacterales bacterium]